VSVRLAVPAGAYSRAASAHSAAGRVVRGFTGIGFVTPESVDQSLVEISKAQGDLAQLARDLKSLRPRKRATTRKD
jgi:hypothetical protein